MRSTFGKLRAARSKVLAAMLSAGFARQQLQDCLAEQGFPEEVFAKLREDSDAMWLTGLKFDGRTLDEWTRQKAPEPPENNRKALYALGGGLVGAVATGVVATLKQRRDSATSAQAAQSAQATQSTPSSLADQTLTSAIERATRTLEAYKNFSEQVPQRPADPQSSSPQGHQALQAALGAASREIEALRRDVVLAQANTRRVEATLVATRRRCVVWSADRTKTAFENVQLRRNVGSLGAALSASRDEILHVRRDLVLTQSGRDQALAELANTRRQCVKTSADLTTMQNQLRERTETHRSAIQTLENKASEQEQKNQKLERMLTADRDELIKSERTAVATQKSLDFAVTVSNRGSMLRAAEVELTQLARELLLCGLYRKHVDEELVKTRAKCAGWYAELQSTQTKLTASESEATESQRLQAITSASLEEEERKLNVCEAQRVVTQAALETEQAKTAQYQNVLTSTRGELLASVRHAKLSQLACEQTVRELTFTRRTCLNCEARVKEMQRNSQLTDDQTTQEIDKLQQSNAEIQANLQECQKSKTSLEKMLEAARQEIVAATRNHTLTTAELKQARGDVTQTRIALARQYATHRANLTRVQTELDERKAEVQKQAAELAQKTTELSGKEAAHAVEKVQSAEQSAKQSRQSTEKAQTLQAIIVAMRAELVASSRFLTICENQRDQLAHNLALTRRQCVTLDASQKAADVTSAREKITATMAAERAYDALKAQKQALETKVTTSEKVEAALRRMLTEAGQVIKKLSRDVTLSSAERERLARESAQTRASLVREHARHLVENRTLAVRCGDSDRNLEQKEEQNTQLSTQNQTLSRTVTALGRQLITSEYYLTLWQQAHAQVVRELVKTRLKCVEWNAKCKKSKPTMKERPQPEKSSTGASAARPKGSKRKGQSDADVAMSQVEDSSDLVTIKNFATLWCKVERAKQSIETFTPGLQYCNTVMDIVGSEKPAGFVAMFKAMQNDLELVQSTRQELWGRLNNLCSNGEWDNDWVLTTLIAFDQLLQRLNTKFDQNTQALQTCSQTAATQASQIVVTSGDEAMAMRRIGEFVTKAPDGQIFDPAALERVAQFDDATSYFTQLVNKPAYSHLVRLMDGATQANLQHEEAVRRNAANKVGSYITFDSATGEPRNSVGDQKMRYYEGRCYFARHVTSDLYTFMQSIMEIMRTKNLGLYLSHKPSDPVGVVGRTMLISQENEYYDIQAATKIKPPQNALQFMKERMDHLMRINEDPMNQLAFEAIGKAIFWSAGKPDSELVTCIKKGAADCGDRYTNAIGLQAPDRVLKLFGILRSQALCDALCPAVKPDTVQASSTDQPSVRKQKKRQLSNEEGEAGAGEAGEAGAGEEVKAGGVSGADAAQTPGKLSTEMDESGTRGSKREYSAAEPTSPHTEGPSSKRRPRAHVAGLLSLGSERASIMEMLKGRDFGNKEIGDVYRNLFDNLEQSISLQQAEKEMTASEKNPEISYLKSQLDQGLTFLHRDSPQDMGQFEPYIARIRYALRTATTTLSPTPAPP